MKKKLLWVGDAGVPTGFARATHETLDVLRKTYDVTVLGINYRGDPHNYPYPIWGCLPGGDHLGYGRLLWLMDLVKPDVVVFQNDPWLIPAYLERLDLASDEHGHVIRVGAIAVDGKNCQGEGMNGLDMAIFWTKFGEEEARAGGFTKPAAVVPLGVDAQLYTPGDRREARQRRGMTEKALGIYVVGNVNRNQPRKRLDLTIQYFAEWVKTFDIPDAYLYLHVAPTGDKGYDCKALAKYYGIEKRVLLLQPQIFYGISEEDMVDTYRSFDVQMSTTLGEGFGLTTFEGMACGIPQIVPKWSALRELAEGAAELIPCSTTAAAPQINTIGGIPDREQMVLALQDLYVNPRKRAALGERGRVRANEARFEWKNIGAAFTECVQQAETLREGVGV